MTRLHLLAILGGLLIGGSVTMLLRRGQLQYRYAVLWLAMVATTAPFAVRPSLLDSLASWLGIADPPNLLFFIGLVGVIALVSLLTSELSRAQSRLHDLARAHALLEERVRRQEEAQEERTSR